MTSKDGGKVSFYRVRAKYDPDYYVYWINQSDLYEGHIEEVRELSKNKPTWLEMQKAVEKYDLAAKLLHDEYNNKLK